MIALRLHGPRDLRLHDEPDPVPGAGEELVRVTAVGLCGSDRHWFLDAAIGGATSERPLVLGHEIAGVVEAGPRRGLRVALEPADPCEHCELCLTGRSNLCPNTRFAGYAPTDGGLRTLMAWPARLLVPLPDTIDDPTAALLEPLGVALHALDLGKARRGMSAGVFGCGPIGLLLVQLLRSIGCAPVVATEPLAHRRAAAEALGAVAGPAWPGSGLPAVDVSFEVAGEDEAVADAVDAVRPGGRVVLVGIPPGERTSFPASSARRKGLTLLLSRRMAATDLARAIRVAESGVVDLASLVTARYPLDRHGQAFEGHAGRQGMRTVIEPAAVAT